MDPVELARQRAAEDNGVVSPASMNSSYGDYYGARPPSNSDWGMLRGPSDPHGDGGMSTISLPPMGGDMDGDIDDGGMGSDVHPSRSPYRHLLDKPQNELTEDERDVLFTELTASERARQSDYQKIHLEREKFNLEKRKSIFSLLRNIAVGFVALAGISFTVLLGVMVYLSLQNKTMAESGALGAILNTFASFFQILAGM